ncbi:MAG: hypothetical protein AUH86_21085 [Acidobacteria bacterium 13_1_40CM_4_58_4]|nr:MAG: hypothetical protein AUH86_21085 [Acidobacteria bacterium 13_1_40CM_4_58_4]
MKHCILVVEDNQLNRELLRDWLEVEGYEVWPATDLQTSYDVFAKRIPDAVLLDINLGKDDGLDARHPRDCRNRTRSGGGAGKDPAGGLQGVPVEANRLSSASSRVEPLAAKSENVASPLVGLLPWHSILQESRMPGGATGCPRGSWS